MSRQRKEVSFKQVFLWSSLVVVAFWLFQSFHWINILWGLFVVLVIVPTVYYFINGRSFQALNYKSINDFSGVMGFFVLVSAAVVILITVFIGVFAPSFL
ncbi:MAG: hypothetical protein L0L10_03525 [Tetragenococcus sp.]|nr:hypothetical protein [Tetragenococcus sp.]